MARVISTAKIYNVDIPSDFNFQFQLDNIIHNEFSGFIEISPLHNIQERIKQFNQYHSSSNKQTLGYSPRCSVHTANLLLHYDNSFLPNLTYVIKEKINIFIHEVLAYILGAFQRRRLVFETVDVQPVGATIMAFPVAPCFFSSYIVDSVTSGPTMVQPQKIGSQLKQALSLYFSVSKEQQNIIISLLRRYKDQLNSLYCYERAEALWKLIEALQKTELVSQRLCSAKQKEIDIHHDQMKKVIGIEKKESKNLKNFISSLIAFDIDYEQEDLKVAFNFRNYNTHEYLRLDLIGSADQKRAFVFLNKIIEKIIFKILLLDSSAYIDSGYLIIDDKIF